MRWEAGTRGGEGEAEEQRHTSTATTVRDAELGAGQGEAEEQRHAQTTMTAGVAHMHERNETISQLGGAGALIPKTPIQL